MIFSFPSLVSLAKSVVETFRRFPLSLSSAIIASGISIFIIDHNCEAQKEFEYLWKVVMCCGLGLNLFLSLTFFSERAKHNFGMKMILQLAALALVVVYYFLLPEFQKMLITDIVRYILFTIGLHLLVAFSPFVARGEINGFWQFNKSLFLRFLLSMLYAGVLYIGLSLAILAIDNLFQVKIKGERYGQLWIFVAGIFNTWFFLAGVPKNFSEMEAVTDYPKGLKIFTQFILLPLITVYLLILYAYLAKILIQWELPKGWVSYLVNTFSVFGILSLLLIYPIRNKEENKWIKIFSQWFYCALFPLIVLLGFAIGKRIMQYGITENRYFVLVIALWLTGIAIYFLFSKKGNIKLIPITLCIIAFLSSFGPWGVFNISERSQVNRLTKILTEEKILVNGKIKKSTDTIQEKQARQITSIMRYLDNHYGFESIKPWFTENVDSLFVLKDSIGNDYKTSIMLNLMGVQRVDDYYSCREDEEDGESIKTFYFDVEHGDQIAVDVSGYDYCLNYQHRFSIENNDYKDSPNVYFHLGKDSINIELSSKDETFFFLKNKKEVLKFQLSDFTKGLKEYNQKNKKSYYDNNIPNDKMIFEAVNDSVRVKFYFRNISGNITENKMNIDNINAMVLIKFISYTKQEKLY
ncbi:MAG: DUF4153 domain-containing protein [Bacteroidota bacterium]